MMSRESEEKVRRERQRFNELIELKKEVNALCIQAGQPSRYALDFGPPSP